MTKITRGLIESYIACRYKSYLMMEGHKPETGRESKPPIQSNCEQPPTPFEQVTRLQNESRADSLIELTPSLLRRGTSEITGSLYQTTSSSIQFDGLRKVHGSSDVGDFHYTPILFHPNGQVQEAQKSLLYVYGFILNKLQGRPPEHGILQRTKGKSSTVPATSQPDRPEGLQQRPLRRSGQMDRATRSARGVHRHNALALSAPWADIRPLSRFHPGDLGFQQFKKQAVWNGCPELIASLFHFKKLGAKN